MYRPAADLTRYDVISFDVFDTLVRRPFVRPDDGLRYLEEIHRVSGWLKLRKEIEGKALVQTGLESVSLVQIYSQIPDKWNFMLTKELEFESRILRANEDMLEFFNHVKSLNKRLIIVSDTYYSSQQITDFLGGCGYVGIEKVYTSCDAGMTKSSGRLFDFVLNDLSPLNSASLLHIGDNRHSDIKRAKERHIKAEHYPSVLDSLYSSPSLSWIRQYWEARNKLEGTALLAVSHQVGVIAAMYRAGLLSESIFVRVFSLAFPFLLCQFDAYVFRQLTLTGFRDVAFVARDGYLLKHLFDLKHNQTLQFNTQYVYASRFLIRSVLLDFEGLSNADRQALAQYLGPAVSDFAEVSGEHKETEAWVTERREKNLHDFRDYFEHIGLLSKDVCVVDWGGQNMSAQRFLSRFSRKTVGVYCDAKSQDDIDVRILHKDLLSNNQLSEVFVTSPEPPVYGVVRAGNQYRPVFKPAFEPSESNKSIEDLAKFLEKFVDAFDFGLFAERTGEVAQLMDIYSFFVRSISKSELDQISQFGFCGSISHESKDYQNVWLKLRNQHRKSNPTFSYLLEVALKFCVALPRRVWRKLKRLISGAS